MTKRQKRGTEQVNSITPFVKGWEETRCVFLCACIYIKRWRDRQGMDQRVMGVLNEASLGVSVYLVWLLMNADVFTDLFWKSVCPDLA